MNVSWVLIKLTLKQPERTCSTMLMLLKSGEKCNKHRLEQDVRLACPPVQLELACSVRSFIFLHTGIHCGSTHRCETQAQVRNTSAAFSSIPTKKYPETDEQWGKLSTAALPKLRNSLRGPRTQPGSAIANMQILKGRKDTSRVEGGAGRCHKSQVYCVSFLHIWLIELLFCGDFMS